MKFFLFVLVLGIFTSTIHSQIHDDTDDEVSDLFNFLYDADFARKDTSRRLLQFNFGQSAFKNNKPISDDFLPSVHYDIKLMFKFLKNPKFINGAIGIQFSENMFNVADQYADISDEGIVLSPSGYNDLKYNRIKLRSLSIPMMIYIRPREVRFLNKFKLGVGFIPGFNFKNGIQKKKYQVDDKNYILKESSDFDMTDLRASLMFELSFNNLSFFYELGINRQSSLGNFTEGINKLGIGFAF
jgi:hypothetical protein